MLFVEVGDWWKENLPQKVYDTWMDYMKECIGNEQPLTLETWIEGINMAQVLECSTGAL